MDFTRYLRRAQLRSFVAQAAALLVIFGLAVFFLASGKFAVLLPTDVLSRADGSFLAWGTLFFVLGFFARALRWKWLFAADAPVKTAEVVAIGFAFFGANLYLPFRLGEALRPVLFARRGYASLPTSFGLALAERVIDMGCAALILLIGMGAPSVLEGHTASFLGLEVDTRLIRKGAFMVSAFSLALCFSLPFFWTQRARLSNLLGRLPKPFSSVGRKIVEQLLESLSFLSRARAVAGFFVTSLVYWGLVVLTMWCLMRAAGLPANAFQAALSSGLLVFGLIVPSPPAQAGVHHAASYIALLACFSSAVVQEQGAVFVGAFYFLQLLVCGLLGIGAGLYLARTSNKGRPAGEVPSDPKGAVEIR